METADLPGRVVAGSWKSTTHAPVHPVDAHTDRGTAEPGGGTDG